MDIKKSFQNIRLITTVSSFNLTNIFKEFSQKLTKRKKVITLKLCIVHYCRFRFAEVDVVSGMAWT